jgi:hypothetical protein
VVRSLRTTFTDERGSMQGLPSDGDLFGASCLRVPGTRSGGGPPLEVLRVAWGGGGARRGPRGARPPAGRRGDVGPARGPATGRARFRPGSRARAGARPRAGPPRGRLRPKDEGDRSTSATDPRGAIGSDGRRVRMHPREALARPPAPGRRRAHHGRHGFGLRRSAPRGGSARDPSPHRLPLVHRPASRSSRLAPPLRARLYSSVLPSGSVVARGSTPVVDASRGRNDPRKATLGRRAWSGLEVSPAPASERGAGRGCESAVLPQRTDRRRTPPQASVGSKTRSAGREHPRPNGSAEDRRWT